MTPMNTAIGTAAKRSEHTRVDLDELKARHPLGGVVEAYGVRLSGGGRVRQGRCPFHEETSASFTVYGDTRRFHCFGCGATGDVLDFVRRTEGLTLPEAIRRLDGGGFVPHHNTAVPVREAGSQRASSAPRDPALLGAATRYHARCLRRSRVAQAYLLSRGIDPATAARLDLGCAPGQGLREHLRLAGFSDRRIAASGLFTERGSERFAGMVTVPDGAAGRVRWIAGRAIDPGVSPRFQALPGRKPVLGLGSIDPAARWVVLTEGLFDRLALSKWGIPSCAALGTQGLERIARRLRRFRRVLLAFDADDAGRTTTARLRDLLGPRAVAVSLPAGIGDVGELAALPGGEAAFRISLRAALRWARTGQQQREGQEAIG